MKFFDRFFLACLISFVPAAAGAADNVFAFGANPHLSAGARALQIGNYSEGIDRTLTGLESEFAPLARARAFNNLCAGYTAIRQFDAAIRYCDRAAEINGRNWRVYNNRALALLGLGRIDEARRDLATGLAINPGSPSLAEVARLIEAQTRSLQTAQLFSPT